MDIGKNLRNTKRKKIWFSSYVSKSRKENNKSYVFLASLASAGDKLQLPYVKTNQFPMVIMIGDMEKYIIDLWLIDIMI